MIPNMGFSPLLWYNVSVNNSSDHVSLFILFFKLFFTQKSRSAIYCCPLGLGAFVLDYIRGRRNGEVVLHGVPDKISRSVVAVPLEASPY